MKFIIGTKREMTQIFGEDGKLYPVTKLLAGPCCIISKKDVKKDGYSAVQLGFGDKKEKKTNNPLKGFLKKILNRSNGFLKIKEFRISEDDAMFSKMETGKIVSVGAFEEGDIVDVQGISKGKGFQGVVKRHHFAGGNKSHGNKDQLRMPGSIGATGPAKVFKGVRMGGHMGDELVTTKNLKIVKIDLENNALYIQGSLPGARTGLVYVTAQGEFDLDSIQPKKEEAKKEVKEVTPAVNAEVKEEVKVEEKKTEEKPVAVKKEEKKVEEKVEEVKKEEKKEVNK